MSKYETEVFTRKEQLLSRICTGYERLVNVAFVGYISSPGVLQYLEYFMGKATEDTFVAPFHDK